MWCAGSIIKECSGSHMPLLDQPPGRASKSFQIVEYIDDSFDWILSCASFPTPELGLPLLATCQ